jgi:hypothetical protein
MFYRRDLRSNFLVEWECSVQSMGVHIIVCITIWLIHYCGFKQSLSRGSNNGVNQAILSLRQLHLHCI